MFQSELLEDEAKGGEHSLFFSFLKKTYLLIFIFWRCSVFVAAWRLSLFVESQATLCSGVQASHCGGSPCCGAWVLGMQASVVVALGL